MSTSTTTSTTPTVTKCCESLKERVKEKMTHIEQLRKEVLNLEEDRTSLLVKCQNLEQEKAWLEKEKGFLSRQNNQMKEESARVMKMWKEKQTDCTEIQHLLDVIYKDRDECINEKMKVSTFYRKENQKLRDDNADLRKENNYLRKKFEEELVNALFEKDKSEEEQVDNGVVNETHQVLCKLVNTIAEDRNQNAFVQEGFEMTRQQIDSLQENLSRIELALSRYFPKFGKIEEEKKPKEPTPVIPETHIPATYGREEKKEIGCACNEQHRTLDQLLACPNLDRRIRDGLDQAKEVETVKDVDESEDESSDDVKEEPKEDENSTEKGEEEQDTSFEMVENNHDN